MDRYFTDDFADTCSFHKYTFNRLITDDSYSSRFFTQRIFFQISVIFFAKGCKVGWLFRGGWDMPFYARGQQSVINKALQAGRSK